MFISDFVLHTRRLIVHAVVLFVRSLMLLSRMQVLKVQAAGGVKRHRKFTEEDLELLRSQDSSCPVVPEDDVAISLRAERKSQLSLLTSMFHGSDSVRPVGNTKGFRALDLG